MQILSVEKPFLYLNRVLLPFTDPNHDTSGNGKKDKYSYWQPIYT